MAVMTTATYDRHADWYEDYVTGRAAEFTRRVGRMLGSLLGPGGGRACLDVACGTGVHAPAVRSSGWRPVGVDVSTAQLRYARTRLPVTAGDGTTMPIASASLDAAFCAVAHTDVPDYPAVIREIARVLRPGGVFVHVGVHPCFVGAFADRSVPDRVVLSPGYTSTGHTFESWAPHGVRARVGAWHLPLAALVNAVASAGLTVRKLAEDGSADLPDLLGLVARRP
jgi:SAM-dependent methyltransferase